MKLGTMGLIYAIAMLAGTAHAQLSRAPRLPIANNPPKTICDWDPFDPSCSPDTLPAVPGPGTPGSGPTLCDWIPDHPTCQPSDTLPKLPGPGRPGTVKTLCDWIPDHPSCLPPVIVNPPPTPSPTYSYYLPRFCSMSNDADVLREFGREIPGLSYSGLVQSFLRYKSLKLPEARTCLDKILLANSCEREKAYNVIAALSCVELDQDPAEYKKACMSTLENASDDAEVNAFGAALGKVVERTHCSVDKISEFISKTNVVQQPDCEGSTQCLGSNVSLIPQAVRLYRFPGNRGIQWKHQLKLVHEYNPRRWRSSPTAGYQSVYRFADPDCTEQDLKNIYVTDRINRKTPLSSLTVYTHKEFPTTKDGWDAWDARKASVYEEIASTELLDFGPDIFFDVTPRDASGNLLPFNVASVDKLDNRTFEAETCRIQVVKVDSFPTDGSITAINTEAARLEGDLENKGKAYATAKNYDTFVKAYEIPRLNTMSQSLETAFSSLIAAAMSGDCETLPAPPLLPIGGMVPFAPDTLETDCEDNGIEPSTYGLSISDWKQLNLYSTNVIYFDQATKAYKLNLSREKAAWYFEARERQPRIKEALEKLLVEITQIQTGIYFKQHPDEVKDYQLPVVQTAITELTNAIAAARTFVDAFDAYKQVLGERLAELRRQIEQREKELPRRP